MISMEQTLTGRLNDLMIINNERGEGYEVAAKVMAGSDLKSFFSMMASHSRRFGRELLEELKRLVGDPKAAATAHATTLPEWRVVKAAVAARDRHAILTSCESCEDASLRAYQELLESDDGFPDDVRERIEKQFIMLRQDYDRIRMLRETGIA